DRATHRHGPTTRTKYLERRPRMQVRTLLGFATVAGALTATGMPAQAQAVIDGPKVSWNLSTWGTKRAFTAGMEYVADQLSERTGGKFTIKIHYGEALSKARENFDGIKLGAFQAAQFCNFRSEERRVGKAGRYRWA